MHPRAKNETRNSEIAPENESTAFADELAAQVCHLLLQRHRVLVLAESCTAGLIAATIARIPGASNVLAGSAVVYQIPTKHCWLNVPDELMERFGVVSAEVALAMAEGVLQQTPHANFALSITGHLGPDAPPDLDGMAWLACVDRESGRTETLQVRLDDELPGPDAGGHNGDTDPVVRRRQRQRAAVIAALQFVLSFHLPGN